MNKKHFSIRKLIQEESYKKIGIRVNQSVAWVELVAAFCRAAVIPMIKEKTHEYAEPVNHNETFVESLCKTLQFGTIGYANLYKAIYNDLLCPIPENWIVEEDDIWFDDELDKQISFEHGSCNHTMVVIDLRTLKVEVL